MTNSKKFQKNVENFTCEKCGVFVKGSGFTNHCPKCLWSKHVDINPGDRLASCLGLMEPTGIETKSAKYVIVHQCTRCDFIRKNKIGKDDDFEVVLKMASRP